MPLNRLLIQQGETAGELILLPYDEEADAARKEAGLPMKSPYAGTGATVRVVVRRASYSDTFLWDSDTDEGHATIYPYLGMISWLMPPDVTAEIETGTAIVQITIHMVNPPDTIHLSRRAAAFVSHPPL